MYRELEIRKLNNNDNCWTRKNKNGSVEYYSKDYYNSDFTRKGKEQKNKLLEDIEKLLN